MRDEEALRLLSIDPHSPNEFRCNQIVRNIDEFAETFGLTESDALWLDARASECASGSSPVPWATTLAAAEQSSDPEKVAP